MEIRDEAQDGITVVELVGRLDELATSDVDKAFSGLLSRGVTRMVLDMSSVEYVSSSGLRVLMMLYKAMKKCDGRLCFCGLSPFVAEVFDISNLARLFTIEATREDALKALM